MREARPRTEPERGWAAQRAHCSPLPFSWPLRGNVAGVSDIRGLRGLSKPRGNHPCSAPRQQLLNAERCGDADGRAVASVLAAGAAVGRTARAWIIDQHCRIAAQTSGSGAMKSAGSAASITVGSLTSKAAASICRPPIPISSQGPDYHQDLSRRGATASSPRWTRAMFHCGTRAMTT